MPASRRCPKCPRIIPAGQRYCPTHMAEYEASRGTPTQRGYGQAHQHKRAAIQARIDAGETVRCWDCNQPLVGRAWHLDHNPTGGYRGPSCVPCNTSDGGRRAHGKDDVKGT